MKMGMRHCIQCSQPIVVRNVGGNFGYVRGKGFKQQTFVISAEEDGFFLKELEAYPR
jgi:hypothetical protein